MGTDETKKPGRRDGKVNILVRDHLEELRKDIDARRETGRDTNPAAINRRRTMRSKASALMRAKSAYARRFIRCLADRADLLGLDMFMSFRSAVTAAPGADRIGADPLTLLLDPSRLSSDMRIAICRSYGGEVVDDIIFAGFYPPPGAELARMIYRIGLEVNRPVGVRFIPWLVEYIRSHGLECNHAIVAVWMKAEGRDNEAPVELLEQLLH